MAAEPADDNQAPDMERLIVQYGDRLLRMCLLYLGNRALAEDAVQDTFIRVYEKYQSFRGQSAEGTWVTAIAINICRNYLRSPWRRRNVGEKGLYLATTGEPACPNDGTVTAEIKALPRYYREVIVLFYYQEMKIRDIAALLRIPEATVASRLRRARAILKERLKEWYFDD